MEKETLNEQLFDAARNNDLELAKLLIEKGADVNAKEWDGSTPLHVVAFNGSLEFAKLLIEKGADVNCKDKNAFTPLHLAADDKLEVIELLIEKGAYLNAKNELGYTALHCAALYNSVEVAKLLIEKGADVNIKNHPYGALTVKVNFKLGNNEEIYGGFCQEISPIPENAKNLIESSCDQVKKNLLEKYVSKKDSITK